MDSRRALVQRRRHGAQNVGRCDRLGSCRRCRNQRRAGSAGRGRDRRPHDDQFSSATRSVQRTDTSLLERYRTMVRQHCGAAADGDRRVAVEDARTDSVHDELDGEDSGCRFLCAARSAVCGDRDRHRLVSASPGFRYLCPSLWRLQRQSHCIEHHAARDRRRFVLRPGQHGARRRQFGFSVPRRHQSRHCRNPHSGWQSDKRSVFDHRASQARQIAAVRSHQCHDGVRISSEVPAGESRSSRIRRWRRAD